MSFVSVVIQLCCLLLVCLTIGRRVALLLPRAIAKEIGFYISPALGVACLVIITTLYGWLSNFVFVYSLSLVLILLCICLVYEKDKILLFKNWAILCLFAIIYSLPVLAPVFLHGGYNPFTDIFTYIAQAQWLQEHSFAEKAIASGFYPANTQVVLYQATGSRMGASFVLAFVQSLFNLSWSYYAYIPAVALVLSAGCVALGGVIRQVIPKTSFIVILALSLLPIISQNGFIFGAEWGFYPQTFGLTFGIAIVAILPSILKEISLKKYSFLLCIIYIFPVSICTAALLFAYNEPFPIFGLALLLFLTIFVCAQKNSIKNVLLFVVIYAIQVLLLVNYEGIRIAKNLLQTIGISHEKAAIGWPVLWSPIQFLAHAFGMKSAFQNGIYHIEHYISVWLFPLFFVFLVYLIYQVLKKYKENRIIIYFLLCVDFVFLLMFLKFRYFSYSPVGVGVGFTFLQFKIAKYASIFSLALVGISFAYLWVNYTRFRVLFALSYLAAMLLGLYIHCHIIANVFTGNFLEVLRQQHLPFNVLLGLRDSLKKISPNDPIYVSLGSENSKLRQMVAYVLYDRKIAGDYNDDGYIKAHLPAKEIKMDPGIANWLLTINPVRNLCLNKETKSKLFSLSHAPFTQFFLDSRQGGYDNESNATDTWNWVKDKIQFNYVTIGSREKISFGFKVGSNRVKRNFTIKFINGDGKDLAKFVVNVAGEKYFKSPWLELNTKKFSIVISADGEPMHLSPGDSRLAKFVVANLIICANKKNCCLTGEKLKNKY